MSVEAQAEETISEEIEIETTEVEETEETEVEEVEIVAEGEEEPPSVPLHVHKRRLSGKNRKLESANSETEEVKRKAAMLEEENKLLRLQAQQGKTTAKRPNEDDFDTDEAYQTAKEAYDKEQMRLLAAEVVNESIGASQAQTTQAQHSEALSQKIDKHYERSATLKVSDYEETEEAAADILGDDVARQIVANTDDSHLLMYHLGKNPAKAQKLKALLESNPMKGVMEIGRLAGTLKVKPKGKTAPDPETEVKGGGGGGGGDWLSRIDKARTNAAKTGDLTKLMELKKQARAAGVNI